jgi:tartrate dehydratase alpha subunit/fumarate hydratase class I-like protein
VAILLETVAADRRLGSSTWSSRRLNGLVPNACPPVVVRVGVGGTFDASALLAKKAALRELTIRNARPDLADLRGRRDHRPRWS